jgi:hypothetical protein
MTKNHDAVKKEIIKKFENKIKGKTPIRKPNQLNNAGWEGDWITKKMGLTKNGKNEPDYKGFEMKKKSIKISFGDWSPDEAIFKFEMSREEFLFIFGSVKNGRSSWSGSVFPKVNSITRGGQEIFVNNNGDIEIIYSYNKDRRRNKDKLVPTEFREDGLLLAIWKKTSLEKFITKKFGQHGFFILSKNKKNEYSKIIFGPPLNYETFIANFKKGIIFLDCGMVSGNPRPYMTFRASGNFWHKIAINKIKIRKNQNVDPDLDPLLNNRNIHNI